MSKIRRVTGLLLIIIGVTIIGTVAYKKYETSKRQKEILKIFDEGSSEGKITGDLNQGGSASLDATRGYTPIAIVEIPSINLSQALVEGVSDNILQYFLGHFEDSVMPGEVGNFAVAGHRVSDYSDAFINLYKVKVGDKVIVKTRNKKFTYEINDSFIVDPSRVDVLNKTEDATITLITCTVGAKERVIVKGKLISTEDLNS